MYGTEVRVQVIGLVKGGKSQVEVSQFLGISLRTIQGWCGKEKRGESLEPNTHGSRHRKVDQEALKAYVADHCDATLEEIGKVFEVRGRSIFYQLKKLKITLKKRRPSTKNGLKRKEKSSNKLSQG